MAKKLTVALIYDFDGTLSPGNMQEYDFIPAVGKSNREFWEESNQTAMEQDGDPILAYMYRMLHEAKNSGISLRRESFARSGQERGSKLDHGDQHGQVAAREYQDL